VERPHLRKGWNYLWVTRPDGEKGDSRRSDHPGPG
jgi:hypothetical protein